MDATGRSKSNVRWSGRGRGEQGIRDEMKRTLRAQGNEVGGTNVMGEGEEEKEEVKDQRVVEETRGWDRSGVRSRDRQG